MAVERMSEEQLRTAADIAWSTRWQFAWDMNGDGLVTSADALLWLKWIILAPGDCVLLLLMMQGTPPCGCDRAAVRHRASGCLSAAADGSRARVKRVRKWMPKSLVPGRSCRTRHGR